MTVFLYILKWHDIPAMQVVCIYILHNDKKEKKKRNALHIKKGCLKRLVYNKNPPKPLHTS